MQSILVTGGAGFIGANFVLDWIESVGSRVINLDKLTYAGNPENLAALAGNDKHVFVQGDIGDKALLAELLEKYRPWAIVNFAAESHVDRSIDGPDEFIQTNVVGVLNLLESTRAYWGGLEGEEREAFRFLHVSTDEVYGSLEADDAAFTERHQYQPNSPYAASKASSDHLVRAYHHTFGLPVLTTNCSNNYGPYQFPEKLIPLFINNALEGKPLPVYGSGQQIRDWLYVGDHCSAIRRVLEAGRLGETYNIGGNCEKTNLQVIEALCAMLDKLVPDSPHVPHFDLLEHVADRPGHDKRYAIDSSKLSSELGWLPAETFESGFRRTVRWYLDNRQWCENIRAGNYQGQRLGLASGQS